MANPINWDSDAFAKIGADFFSKETAETNQSDIWESDQTIGLGLRKKIEPWLTALVQSEHLNLLIGTGLTSGVTAIAKTSSITMSTPEIKTEGAQISSIAQSSAKLAKRGKANAEDYYRTAFELLRGLQILNDNRASLLKDELDSSLKTFINGVATTEKAFLDASDKDRGNLAFLLLRSFLLSFSSRTASRDRLHIFTTNYDRFIEHALDSSGTLWLDRFRGMLRPVFKNSRLELDFHYNPPGIRGEPRYVEGVTRFTKLHGSIDWTFDDDVIYRDPLPFGSICDIEEPSKSIVIYPNSSKDMETAMYPYAELFRDFSNAICRPNNVVVTYGYGFGDDHINRVLKEMITIPSTHLLIISYDKADGRIKTFVDDCANQAQISLMIGKPFGELSNLVQYYLPKPGIDKISKRLAKVLADRPDLEHDEPGKQS